MKKLGGEGPRERVAQGRLKKRLPLETSCGRRGSVSEEQAGCLAVAKAGVKNGENTSGLGEKKLSGSSCSKSMRYGCLHWG